VAEDTETGDGFGTFAADQTFVRLGEDAISLPDAAIDADKIDVISGNLAQGFASPELRRSPNEDQVGTLPGDSDPIH